MLFRNEPITFTLHFDQQNSKSAVRYLSRSMKKVEGWIHGYVRWNAEKVLSWERDFRHCTCPDNRSVQLMGEGVITWQERFIEEIDCAQTPSCGSPPIDYMTPTFNWEVAFLTSFTVNSCDLLCTTTSFYCQAAYHSLSRISFFSSAIVCEIVAILLHIY